MERVRFVEYGGKKVLLLEYKDCRPQEIPEMMEEVRRIVTAQPPNSVLTLSDMTGGQFSREAVRRMKEVAALDRPHVKRAAIVGISSLPQVFYKGIMDFSARDFPAFNTREEALAWLVHEDAAGSHSAA